MQSDFERNFTMAQPISQPGGRSPQDIMASREVIARRKRLVGVLVMMAVCLIFAGIGGAMWIFGSNAAAVMAKGAVQVTARVEETETQRIWTSNGIRYRYYAHLSFADATGEGHLVRIPVEAFALYAMHKGQNLPLRYAVEDPSVVELHEGDLESSSQWGFWLMAGGAAGAVLTILVALLRGRQPKPQ
jgi:type IV secretory pathway TrbD component